jgi:hypothetical protein
LWYQLCYVFLNYLSFIDDLIHAIKPDKKLRKNPTQNNILIQLARFPLEKDKLSIVCPGSDTRFPLKRLNSVLCTLVQAQGTTIPDWGIDKLSVNLSTLTISWYTLIKESG